MSSVITANTLNTVDPQTLSENTSPMMKGLELGSFQVQRRRVSGFIRWFSLCRKKLDNQVKGSTGKEMKSNRERESRQKEKKRILRMRGYKKKYLAFFLFFKFCQANSDLRECLQPKKKKKKVLSLFIITIPSLLCLLLELSLWKSLQEMLLVHRQADFFLALLPRQRHYVSAEIHSLSKVNFQKPANAEI